MLPLLSRFSLARLQRRRVFAQWPRPKQFDYNVVVIGAGAGGLVSAYITAAANAKVALIEQHQMGGDCLNTGCVPSKALIRAAKSAHETRHGARFGIHSNAPKVDFLGVMNHINAAIARIQPHDSRERYTQLGVDCLQGTATLRSPWQVEVNGQVLTTRSVILATGARPRIPELPGLSEVPYLTSDTLWSLTELPEHLVILGGGPIGCEMAQAWVRLGCQVTLIEAGSRLLSREDPEVSERITEQLQREGVDVRLHTQASSVQADPNQVWLNNEPQPVVFTHLLLALGRIPNLSGLGLEQLGVELDATDHRANIRQLQQCLPNLSVVGDAAGGEQFTHAAAHGAWTASLNALFGHLKTFKANWHILPRVTFTDPEVARVGLNITEATAQGIAHEVTTYSMDELDRAIVEGEQGGWIQVLTRPGSDRVLGATIVSPQAGEMITEWVSAMKRKQGLNAILATIHAYPTRSEANKALAGVWKKARQPKRLLQWVGRYLQWRR
jgi:pyruvate/2-oxoglutarate dehydrogenase complex dihydrolipoamide dehydrogenase (E3) component